MSIDFKTNNIEQIAFITKDDVYRDTDGFWIHSLMEGDNIYFNLNQDPRNICYEPEFVRSLTIHTHGTPEKKLNYCRINLMESKNHETLLNAIRAVVYTLEKEYKTKRFHLCICFEMNLFGVLEVRK